MRSLVLGVGMQHSVGFSGLNVFSRNRSLYNIVLLYIELGIGDKG